MFTGISLLLNVKDIKQMVKRPCTKNDWWKQAVESAGDNLIPILIYKYDRRDIMCVIPLFLVTSVDAPNWNVLIYVLYRKYVKD